MPILRKQKFFIHKKKQKKLSYHPVLNLFSYGTNLVVSYAI